MATWSFEKNLYTEKPQKDVRHDANLKPWLNRRQQPVATSKNYKKTWYKSILKIRRLSEENIKDYIVPEHKMKQIRLYLFLRIWPIIAIFAIIPDVDKTQIHQMKTIFEKWTKIPRMIKVAWHDVEKMKN